MSAAAPKAFEAVLIGNAGPILVPDLAFLSDIR